MYMIIIPEKHVIRHGQGNSDLVHLLWLKRGKYSLNNIIMKTFIIAFLLIAATALPILFIPLLAISVVIWLIVSPYVTTHNTWFASKSDLEHELKH